MSIRQRRTGQTHLPTNGHPTLRRQRTYPPRFLRWLVAAAAGVALATSLFSAPSAFATSSSGFHALPHKDVTLQGRDVSMTIKFESAGTVDITRKWDSFNNCVLENGSQYSKLAVHDGSEVQLSVTTVNSDDCFFEQSRMHWQVNVVEAGGGHAEEQADISLSQGGYPHLNDYNPGCERTWGTMRCRIGGILGNNMSLSFG
jgi:hypothetical protein